MRFGRSLLAGDGRYPALESVLRRDAASAARSRRNDLDELERLLLGLDGGYLFVQGPPGSGKTWTGGRLIARLLAPASASASPSTSHKAIHNLLARSRRARTSGLDSRGCKKASGGNPESFYESERIENLDRRRGLPRRGRSSPARPGSSPTRASTGRSTTCSSTRPARSRSPTRSRWGRARGTSSCSAIRCSSPRCSRATHPGRGRLGPRAPARRRDDDPRGPRRLPRADVPDAPGRLPLHLGGVLRGPARARPVHAPTRSTPFGTGVRYLPGGARGPAAGLARGGRARSRRRDRAHARPDGRCAPRGLHGRGALQRPGEPAAGGAARRACRSARWTSSRARRRRSSSSRWRPRAGRTSRARSSSSSRATA